MFASLMCLAMTIYHEARGESLEGQVAIAKVVVNRVNSTAFPASSVCEVVHQGGKTLNKCQFSWYCDGIADDPKDLQAWSTSITIAILSPLYQDNTLGALWYHEASIEPVWATTSYLQLGHHRFYNAIQEKK